MLTQEYLNTLGTGKCFKLRKKVIPQPVTDGNVIPNESLPEVVTSTFEDDATTNHKRKSEDDTYGEMDKKARTV